MCTASGQRTTRVISCKRRTSKSKRHCPFCRDGINPQGVSLPLSIFPCFFKEALRPHEMRFKVTKVRRRRQTAILSYLFFLPSFQVLLVFSFILTKRRRILFYVPFQTHKTPAGAPLPPLSPLSLYLTYISVQSEQTSILMNTEMSSFVFSWFSIYHIYSGS